jgi:acylphosphatase
MADETPSPERILRLVINGRVQGVSYRVWTQQEALSRGISGWVRNRANGDVEALIAGPADVLTIFCEICRAGPPMARVDSILIEEAEAAALAGSEGSFVVLGSA